MGSPWNFVSAQGSRETRVIGLSDGRKSFQIGLAILIQYRSVTDTHPARHVAVAITLNAKALSLKTILRQKQTEPGLVAFHDIRPGNGTGLFLQG